MWLLLNETHMILSNLIWPLGTRSASCKKENNLTNLLNLRIWLRQSTLNVDCIFYGRARCVSSVVIWLNRLLNFPMSYLSLHNALDMGLLVLFVFNAHRTVLEWAHYQCKTTTLSSYPQLRIGLGPYSRTEREMTRKMV